jgi:hypothetical protein
VQQGIWAPTEEIRRLPRAENLAHGRHRPTDRFPVINLLP